MAFIVILLTTVLVYDLVFHTTCFFPWAMVFFGASGGICSIQPCNNGSYCKSFSQHCKAALLSLYPINLFLNWNWNGKVLWSKARVKLRQIDSNLCVLQWALLLVLCLCLQHLKIRPCHLTFLSSFFYSAFTLVFGMLTILIFMKWEKKFTTLV